MLPVDNVQIESLPMSDIGLGKSIYAKKQLEELANFQDTDGCGGYTWYTWQWKWELGVRDRLGQPGWAPSSLSYLSCSWCRIQTDYQFPPASAHHSQAPGMWHLDVGCVLEDLVPVASVPFQLEQQGDGGGWGRRSGRWWAQERQRVQSGGVCGQEWGGGHNHRAGSARSVVDSKCGQQGEEQLWPWWRKNHHHLKLNRSLQFLRECYILESSNVC